VRVLVVEDEPYLAEAVRDGLRLEAIAADIAGDGNTALEMLSINSYDLAVLDRDIPGPSGDEIARRIVASGSGVPILMLTAADRISSCGYGRSTAGARTPDPRSARSRASVWTPSAGRSSATDATSRSPGSSSPCSKCSSPPKAASSAPKSC
jgi:CheY-like chemotaxis protein